MKKKGSIFDRSPRPGAGATLPQGLMAKVRRIQIRTHRLVNTALSGGYRSTFRGTGIEFEEVRPYQIGDDVRNIDWNVTARTGEAYIKNYSEERELTISVLVDTSLSMDFGSADWTKREVAAQLAALIAYVALQAQDKIGLALFGEQPGLHLPPQKGSNHVLRIVREVLAARPSAGGSDLEQALDHQAKVLRRRSVVFVVSDFLEQAVPREVQPWGETLARLSRRHDVIAVRVFDPLEERLPPAGLIDVKEIETGRRQAVDTRSARVREEWAARARARRAELQRVLSRARVDLIELSTAGDVGDPVIAFFRGRMKRYGGHS